MEIAFTWGVFACLASLNAWATWLVLRDPLSTRGQRVAQAAIVWLLPVIGGLLVMRMKSEETEPPAGKYAEVLDPGDDYGLSGQFGRHGGGGHADASSATADVDASE